MCPIIETEQMFCFEKGAMYGDCVWLRRVGTNHCMNRLINGSGSKCKG